MLPTTFATTGTDADAVEMEGAVRLRLKLTKRQWIALDLLIRRQAVHHDVLVAALWRDHPPSNPQQRLCDVISGLRDKLYPLKVEVQVIREFGYAMTAEHKQRLQAWLCGRTSSQRAC